MHSALGFVQNNQVSINRAVADDRLPIASRANHKLLGRVMQELPEYLTLREVSKLLRITPGTARNRLCTGASMPPSFRIGRERLFDRRGVEAWLLQAQGNDRGQRSPQAT